MNATLIFFFLFACWIVWVWMTASTKVPFDPTIQPSGKLPYIPKEGKDDCVNESGFIFLADDFQDWGNQI